MLSFRASALGLAAAVLLMPGPAPAAPAPAATAAPAAPTTATPGNRVHGVVYTIERIRAVKSLGGENYMPVTRAAGVFVILTLRMENVTKEPISFLTTSLALTDESRNLYSVSTEALTSQMMSGDTGAQLVTTLQPGLIRRVTAVFDMPWVSRATFYLSGDDAGAKRGGATFELPAP